jgi:hypothetical protein
MSAPGRQDEAGMPIATWSRDLAVFDSHVRQKVYGDAYE